MSKIKFRIYYIVMVHVASWRQPDWLSNFWDWSIEKMESWGWDAGIKEKHDAIIKAMLNAEKKDESL